MQNSLYVPKDINITSSDFISRCLGEYEQKLNEQGQFSQYDDQDENLTPDQILAQEQALKYYGYEDKKSITIKPIRMHKDLICLGQQNQQKKKLIEQLQKQNLQLKQNYQGCMKQNQKVQRFLKDIQFTFKNDKRAQKANQIMLKAKRMLYRQAIQCQKNAKRITKSSQANTVQQAKMYIQLLQGQKTRLRLIIEQSKRQNDKSKQQQDFNAKNEHKFQTTLQRVQRMLNIQMQRCNRHHQINKIQKGMVSTGLKQKQIVLKKHSIQSYYEKLKDLMLRKQGEQYEMVVLEKKRKDKIKLVEEMKQFKNDISYKKSSIQQLEKELKEKLKTYDYMSKWTRELKAKLEQKKENHIINKISYEKKINALSRQFEDWNKEYKMELVQEQLGNINGAPVGGMVGNIRKKGSTNKEAYFSNVKDLSKQDHGVISKRLRLVRSEEIRRIAKKVKLWVLQNQIDLEHFLKHRILKVQQQTQGGLGQMERRNPSFLKQNSDNTQNSNRQLQKNNMLSNIILSGVIRSQFYPPRQSQSSHTLPNTQQEGAKISLKQLFQNIKSQLLPILNEESQKQVMKLARYVVEDNVNPSFPSVNNGDNMMKTSDGMVENVLVQKKLALTVLLKLFQNQLKSKQQVQEIKKKFKEFLIKFYDPFRYDILKVLLCMGGLKAIQRVEQVQAKSKIPEASQTDKGYQCQAQTSGGTSNMSNMKRNQQLHFQLQLDQEILLRELKKHVIQQFYVVRYRQLIDLMIYQQFGQVQKQRLGMFDRICQLITQKKLIRQNINKDYNFDRIVGMDGSQVREKEIVPREREMVLPQPPKSQQTFWILPKKKVSGVSEVVDYQQPDAQNKKQPRKLSWLDDLMSDDGKNSQSQSQFSNQEY